MEQCLYGGFQPFLQHPEKPGRHQAAAFPAGGAGIGKRQDARPDRTEQRFLHDPADADGNRAGPSGNDFRRADDHGEPEQQHRPENGIFRDAALPGGNRASDFPLCEKGSAPVVPDGGSCRTSDRHGGDLGAVCRFKAAEQPVCGNADFFHQLDRYCGGGCGGRSYRASGIPGACEKGCRRLSPDRRIRKRGNFFTGGQSGSEEGCGYEAFQRGNRAGNPSCPGRRERLPEKLSEGFSPAGRLLCVERHSFSLLQRAAGYGKACGQSAGSGRSGSFHHKRGKYLFPDPAAG